MGNSTRHAEVVVAPEDNESWHCTIEPVYVFPIMDDNGTIVGWERRVYDDVVVLHERSMR